jgi:hypothetical protein
MNRFDHLTARYYENDLDESESGELRDLLHGSPDLLREFVITGIREEQLRTAVRRSTALEDAIPFIDAPARRSKLRIMSLAAAAAVAF